MGKLINRTICSFFFLLPAFAGLQAGNPVSKFNIVFIGNSITYGAGLQNPSTQAPPAIVAKYLNDHQCRVNYANCGVSGSTTVDFLPVSHNLYPRVVKAADTLYHKGVPLFFSITIGTNDSAIKGPNGAPVSPDNYRNNLLTIIDSLIRRYPQSHIVVHQPIWYSPNTHNGALYLAEGLARLQSYTPEIIALAGLRPNRVFVGDRKAFNFFKQNHLQYLTPEKGNSGTFYLHPNVLGATKLGEFWAIALKKDAQRIDR